MNKILLFLATGLMMTSLLYAGQAAAAKKILPSDHECHFHPNEWQIDASIAGIVGPYGGQERQGIGANLGANYFFSTYLGIGIDDSVGAGGNSGQSGCSTLQAFDCVQADLLFRYPICAWNLAPYAMIGGGATWPASQGDGNVGGGVEWRLMSNLGFFADCRWLYGNNGSKTVSHALSRVGVRFSF